MKVKIKYKGKSVKKGYHDLFINFIRFINKIYPLTSDLSITFLSERIADITTGGYLPENQIFILTKGRMNRDILRSISHEWIHEYQHTILNRDRGRNIGGRNEDEANAISGQLIKIFEQEFPEYEESIYK
jgi:hypothetical protein